MDRTLTPNPPVELAQWRADTPGLVNLVHLNNPGAALMPRAVHDAILRYLSLEQELGAYEAADRSSGAIDHCYAAIARLLGANARNLAPLQDSSVAFAQAFSALDPGP